MTLSSPEDQEAFSDPAVMSEQRDDIVAAPSITDLGDQDCDPVRLNRGILFGPSCCSSLLACL